MFDYTFPSKIDVIAYGKSDDDFLKKIIAHNSTIFLSSEKKYNFYIFLKMILKFKLSFTNYLSEYIAYTKPKLLISNIDNEPFLWNYKHKFSFLNVVIIQFAVRSRVNDLFGINNIYKRYSIEYAIVDYFFVFNTNVINEYKKLVNSNFIVNGSILNNEIKSNLSIRQNEISFISQYRPNQKIHPIFIVVNGREISKRKFYNTEFMLLPILLKFCNLNSLKLSIIGCSSAEDEISFYNSILGKNNYIFYPKIDKLSSYNYMLTSILNITVDSTLGYESFSRGIKTLFITNRAQDLNEESANFGWPGLFDKSGEFWLNGFTESDVLNLIKKVYEMKNSNFDTLKNKFSKDLMWYAPDNIELKNIIKKIINN
jgi:surface carbohydrate biosynthesis protein